MMSQSRPGLFLDRDGVMVEDVEYLHRIEDCRFMPGLFEVTAAFAAAGYAVVEATNQSGIGRGLYSEAAFTRLSDWMRAEIGENGGTLDAVYYAPIHPTEAKGRFLRQSDWRKPGPGMFHQAARDLGIDLARSVSIGNERRDIDGSRSAGIPNLFLLDPKAAAVATRGDYRVVPTLSDVRAIILGGENT
jgi:D-glycero-D-manno-heptose 1,7-bisphosphate phosphatase